MKWRNRSTQTASCRRVGGLCLSVLLALLMAGCWPAVSLTRCNKANLVAECQRLGMPEGETMGDLLAHDVEVVQAYGECALRHAELAACVKGE